MSFSTSIQQPRSMAAGRLFSASLRMYQACSDSQRVLVSANGSMPGNGDGITTLRLTTILNDVIVAAYGRTKRSQSPRYRSIIGNLLAAVAGQHRPQHVWVDVGSHEPHVSVHKQRVESLHALGDIAQEM